MALVADDRRQRRRTEILEAALRLIGRDGRQALTHRAVAAEAGVPLGATTYYFDSREDLLGQALQHVAKEGIERYDAESADLAAAETPAQLAELLTERLVAAVTDRSALIAENELWLEAARRPDLREAAREWCDAEQRLVAEALERLGSRDPATDASLVVAALDGLGERVLARHEPTDAAKKVRRELTRLIERLLG